MTGHAQSQLILIDDDEILTTAWEHAAEVQGMQIMTFNRIIDFKEILPALKTTMPIYIDYNLSESINGVEFAKVLHEQGFTELYLTTGYPKNHFGDLPWIKGFVSKDPPFLR